MEAPPAIVTVPQNIDEYYRHLEDTTDEDEGGGLFF